MRLGFLRDRVGERFGFLVVARLRRDQDVLHRDIARHDVGVLVGDVFLVGALLEIGQLEAGLEVFHARARKHFFGCHIHLAVHDRRLVEIRLARFVGELLLREQLQDQRFQARRVIEESRAVLLGDARGERIDVGERHARAALRRDDSARARRYCRRRFVCAKAALESAAGMPSSRQKPRVRLLDDMCGNSGLRRSGRWALLRAALSAPPVKAARTCCVVTECAGCSTCRSRNWSPPASRCCLYGSGPSS